MILTGPITSAQASVAWLFNLAELDQCGQICFLDIHSLGGYRVLGMTLPEILPLHIDYIPISLFTTVNRL